MVRTPSTMLDLGTRLPAFSLPDAVSGRTVSDALARDRVTAIMFICNHCPFVKHVLEELTRLDADYTARGVQFVAINSNDVAAHPDDAPEHMKALAESRGWTFPFLYDESQQAALDFRAACTPDFYVFDRAGALIYRGQLDDSRPGNGVPLSGRDLRAALDAALAGQPAPATQKPSLGCNIKWKAGNAPGWFG
jgi:thiol-disulfide isomerase/thioredoxin